MKKQVVADNFFVKSSSNDVNFKKVVDQLLLSRFIRNFQTSFLIPLLLSIIQTE